jgi:tetratricopeptide (TPR) repeat protein
MEAINSIKRIISKMPEEEREVLRNYLRVFNERGKINQRGKKNVKNKSLQLFDLLASKANEQEDERDIEYMVYGKHQSPGTFSRLVLRVRNKIFESLIIDVNINRPNAYSERVKAAIEVRKRLTVAQIIQSRGLRNESGEMFEEIITIGKKYELYEELLLAIRLYISHLTMTTNNKGVAKLLEMYEKYDDCKNAALKAEMRYNEVLIKADYYSGKDVDTVWLENILDNLRIDYKRTGSAQVGFHFFYIESQFFQASGEYKNARESLEDLIRLLDARPSIYTKMRQGAAMLNMADNDIYLLQFERCFGTAYQSLKFFNEGSFNHGQGIDLMFYSKFYTRKYLRALEFIEVVLPKKVEKTEIDFRVGKRLFLKANCLFMLRDFPEALKLLNELNPIEDDKEGWNAGVRILTIMCLLELDLHEEATTKIQALATFISTNGKNSFPERTRLIYSLLLKFKPANFNFATIYQKEKAKIEQLNSAEGNLRWKIKSPEMVIFNQWLLAKTFNQKFVQTIPALQISNRKESIQKQEEQ